MRQYLYVSQFDISDYVFNKYLIDNFNKIESIITNQLAFLDLIDSICSTYNLEEDMFDIVRRSVSNKAHMYHFPMSSKDFVFAVLDYLYHKYADDKLSKCALLRIIYMYDIDITVYDASSLTLLVPFAYCNGKQVVDLIEELGQLKYSLGVYPYDLFTYALPTNNDIFFTILNKYLNLPSQRWIDILERNNDS